MAQSGGPTCVVNSSLAGVINEALNYECIEEIYGGLNGMLGILNEDLVDLAEESQQTIRGLRHTPGAALGTGRFRLRKQQDYERVIEVFAAHNIRFFFHIGGTEAQDTADKIAQTAAEGGYDLRVIGVPKTIDNDLVRTDHCPGYGSAIKHIATTVREIACDNHAMGQGDFVSIVEVMGRSSGWLAAGAALAKGKDRPHDPPHLIYLPEVAFSPEKFFEDVQRVLKREKFCLIVVGEGLVDKDGNYISVSSGPADGYGNTTPGGAGDYLKNLLDESLGLKARTTRLGYAQRSAATHASKADNDEAYLAGQAAVRAAIDGQSGKMITLLRGDSEQYVCETGLAPLSELATGIKALPLEWVHEDGVSMNHQFHKYAQPLIQGEIAVPYANGLPVFAELKRRRVEKRLEAYEVAV